MAAPAHLSIAYSRNYLEDITDYFKAAKLNGNFISIKQPYSFYIGISYLHLNKFDSAIRYLNTAVKTALPASGTFNIIALPHKNDFPACICKFECDNLKNK